jgi:hypothetical protein
VREQNLYRERKEGSWSPCAEIRAKASLGSALLEEPGLLTLALASFGCSKSGVDSGVECTPPPVVSCPDGGGPSFEGGVLPIFRQVCDNCHAPDAAEATVPLLTDYQQIYGPTSGPKIGSEARAINVQVFDNCSMPPATAPVLLSADQRQTLLVWLACGAPDSPAVDAGASD